MPKEVREVINAAPPASRDVLMKYARGCREALIAELAERNQDAVTSEQAAALGRVVATIVFGRLSEIRTAQQQVDAVMRFRESRVAA